MSVAGAMVAEPSTFDRNLELLSRLIRDRSSLDEACGRDGNARAEAERWLCDVVRTVEHALRYPGHAATGGDSPQHGDAVAATPVEYLAELATSAASVRTRRVRDADQGTAEATRPEDLRTIIDTIPTLAWSADAAGGGEFFNQRWLDYSGLSAEETRGSGWIRALHPDDIERVAEQWRQIVASAQPGELEARLRRRDGEYRSFLFRAVPLLDRDGRAIKWYGTNTDIERRRYAEDVLRASQQSFRLIVESIPTLLCTMSAAGEIEFVNQPILDYLGMTREELSDWRAHVHPKDLAYVAERWSRSIETGEPYDIEHRVLGAAGAQRWFHVRGRALRDTEGRIVRWYLALADVDARKRAALALEERERELRGLIDGFPGMVAVAAPDGRHEYANRRTLEFLGRDASGLTGWRDHVHPDDLRNVEEAWRHAMAVSAPLDVQYRLRRHDGAYRWIHARAEPMLDGRRRVLRWYALLVDVHDQRVAEEALRASQAALAHVSRVTTMGELTASIAHEVNQPLGAIVNNASACVALLPTDARSFAEIRDALDDIVLDARRASTVIDRVRHLVRKTPSERAALELGDVVADVLALAHHEIVLRRVTVRADIEPLPRVLGDRVQLQQVLLNLVVNGLDAMATIDEKARVLALSGRRERHGGAVEAVLRVRDAGRGIAPRDLDRMFDAFYTTKPHGMGMGLAISRSIVAAHGGRLWAEPRPGAGATFVVALPAADPAR